jgi:microcystin-dependent protein
MSTPFLGMIILVPYNFAPRGWAFCNGQILSIAQNTALFSLLGTTYGGDGRVTYALPDLRGRVPISQGQGPGLSNYDLGQSSGAETRTLLTSEMPLHTHVISLSGVTAALNVKNAAGNRQTPVGNVLANEATGVTAMYSNAAPDNAMGGSAVTLAGAPTAAAAGGNQPFDLRTPYLTLNYCIALEGIFPSRN